MDVTYHVYVPTVNSFEHTLQVHRVLVKVTIPSIACIVHSTSWMRTSVSWGTGSKYHCFKPHSVSFSLDKDKHDEHRVFVASSLSPGALDHSRRSWSISTKSSSASPTSHRAADAASMAIPARH